MSKIGCVVTYQDLYYEVKKIVKGDEDIEVRVGLLSGAVDVARELIKEGAEVLISRGGTSAYLKREFPYMMVVDIEIEGYDIAKAIHEAKKHDKNIALIIFEGMLYEGVELSALFDCNLKVHYVQFENQVSDTVMLALKEGYTTVIGGKIIQRVAAQLGVRSVMIRSGPHAIQRAIRQARQILKSKDEVVKNMNLIKDVMENTSIGIMAVNESNIIEIANQKAVELLHKSKKLVVGNNISSLMPIKNIDEDENFITEIHGDNLVINKKSRRVGSIGISSVITIEKSSDINEKERDIRSTYVKRGYKANYTFDDINGKSSGIKEAIDISKKYATVDSTILIQGETGTGKELFAQSVHNHSKRKQQPFVAVNCAALTENLLESELFGYVKGAFTGASTKGKVGLFEMADGGTIFLDEIAEISPAVQAKLLRVIQEREVMRIGGDRIFPVDVRIIAATNKKLLDLIEDGKFRKDLYYRISVLKIQIPPLKERKGDLKILFSTLLDYNATSLRRKRPIIDDSCYQVLGRYKWPGNVRELSNFAERLVVVHEGKIILPEMLPKFLDTEVKPPARDFDLNEVKAVLEKNDNNRTRTAKQLGVSRTTLWKMLKDDETLRRDKTK